MSLSPKKHRTLSRQPSSPSLAVGLPPPLPDGIPFSPSNTSTTFKRTRRIHRGDVESSSSSSDSPDMSEDEKDKGWVVTSESHHSLSMSNTPKRKVVGVMDAPMTVGRGAKKPSLQERLAAAAKVKKSRSHGDGLSSSASASGTALVAAENTEPRGVKRPSSGSGGDISKSDKVVVCVR
jgi:centromeric protein E